MMKRKFVTLLLPLITLLATASEFQKKLVVWTKDGTQVMYALNEKPKVTFTETDMVIATDYLEANYAIENIVRFTYESDEKPTSIEDLETTNTPFVYDGEFILFSSLKTNSIISIYALNGTLVFNKTVQTAGQFCIPLSKLRSGVYLVSVNGLTYKIAKR